MTDLLPIVLPPSWHIAFVLTLLFLAAVSFAFERISLEATSVALLVILLVGFEVAPLHDASGARILSAIDLLGGFANPSLVALLALLVMGQGLVQVGALPWFARPMLSLARHAPRTTVGLVLVGALVLSGFVNNTPVVVLTIPLLQRVAARLGWSASRVMMPLSFVAILGGMTTLIGSSTNLLVSSTLTGLGERALGFFEFAALGSVLAAVGAAYSLLILPRILPDRRNLTQRLLRKEKLFLGEIDVTAASALLGKTPRDGVLEALPDVQVLLVQRGEDTLDPMSDEVVIAADDVLIVTADRESLAGALSGHVGFMLGRELVEKNGGKGRRSAEDHVVAEAMIPPASAMVERTLDAIAFHRRFGCLIIGVEHQGQLATRRLSRMRLEAGDELLIVGARESVEALSDNPDLVLMGRGIHDVPRSTLAPRAVAIFVATVVLAATGVLPIVVSALAGMAMMLATKCLDIRNAWRAIDRRILLLVGSTLALSMALQRTGAGDVVARALLEPLGDASPWVTRTLLFALVAITTNLLSNNATAILFTPIAVALAHSMGLEPSSLAIAVLLGANASFATPIGYQTNLLVMGPGHYRFVDFLRGGLPLVALMTVTYAIASPLLEGALR